MFTEANDGDFDVYDLIKLWQKHFFKIHLLIFIFMLNFLYHV